MIALRNENLGWGNRRLLHYKPSNNLSLLIYKYTGSLNIVNQTYSKKYINAYPPPKKKKKHREDLLTSGLKGEEDRGERV